MLANALKDEGRQEEALDAVDVAISAAPDDWRHHRLRGSLLWDIGRHEQALGAYDRGLSICPTDPYTWYYKAYVLYRLRRDEEALPCLDRALTLQRGHSLLMLRLERLERHAGVDRNKHTVRSASPRGVGAVTNDLVCSR